VEANMCLLLKLARIAKIITGILDMMSQNMKTSSIKVYNFRI